MKEARIEVEVVRALAEGVRSATVRLPAGATVADAIAATGWPGSEPGLADSGQQVGIFSRRCGHDAPLSDGDRVELYLPLTEDPNTRRRRG